MLLVDDELCHARLEWILGVPCMKVSEYVAGCKYGIDQENNLEKQIIEFVSPIKTSHGSSHHSLLDQIWKHRDFSNDCNCFIWLSLLLECCAESDMVFNYIAKMPSPNYIFANYCDWFCPFVGEFLRKKDNCVYYDKSSLHRTKMRENLMKFEKKYNELLRVERPQYFDTEGNPKGEYIVQCANTDMIYKETPEVFDNWSIKYKNDKQIISMSPL